jgi:hypothetical protein
MIGQIQTAAQFNPTTPQEKFSVSSSIIVYYYNTHLFPRGQKMHLILMGLAFFKLSSPGHTIIWGRNLLQRKEW